MKWTAFFVFVFSVVSMGGMLLFASSKECIYVDAKETNTVDLHAIKDTEFEESKRELEISEGKMKAANFCIPLSTMTKDNDITVENRYLEHKMYITIEGLEKDFYDSNPLSANENYVSKAYYSYEKGYTRIELQLNKLYEHSAVVKNGNLYLDFYNPKELYEQIIVIDAGHGGDDAGVTLNGAREKEITLKIVKSLKEKLDNTDIRVYYTRLDDRTIADEDRAVLANQSMADMLISIHAGKEEDTTIFGAKALYNPNYFIPNLGSIELSDILEKNLVAACGTQALGLEESKEDVVVKEGKVPTCLLEVGRLSHSKEARLLSDEEYIDKIAQGIYEGILSAYEKTE